MHPHLETLRAAIADGATDDQRRAGAAALDALLSQLAAPPPTATPAPPALDVDQMLDVAIARLGAIVDAKASRRAPAMPPPVEPKPPLSLPAPRFEIPFVPLPRRTP